MSDMTIRFWGVRGSIPTPGEQTRRTGGNTACVEIAHGDDLLILDAGTGLRGLGARMLREGQREATLLLSHLHWDHIQGLPFFVPAYVPGHTVTLAGLAGLREALDRQMKAPCFPVGLDAMRATLRFEEVGVAPMRVGSLEVRSAKLNHPGGVLAYRISVGDRSVVYATDTEHYACPDPRLVELARGADVLIYDAMYTEDEYPAKVGWGHSTWKAGVAVAEAANVDRLVLFHHDPARDDEAVDALEHAAGLARPGTLAAREGEAIELRAEELHAA